MKVFNHFLARITSPCESSPSVHEKMLRKCSTQCQRKDFVVASTIDLEKLFRVPISEENTF